MGVIHQGQNAVTGLYCIRGQKRKIAKNFHFAFAAQNGGYTPDITVTEKQYRCNGPLYSART